MRSMFSLQKLTLGLVLLVTAGMLAGAGCDPNVIAKTEYNGKKEFTCQDLEAEVAKVIDANTAPGALRVAQNDNSGETQPFLEPGQFEIRGEKLYFQLINDLPYAVFLKKGAAVKVTTAYLAPDHLADLESEPQGTATTLIIDEAYINANGGENAQITYIVDVPGGLVDGKQISLTFTPVVIKNGKEEPICVGKKVEPAITIPLGPIDPPCCTDQPWSTVKPKSVVQLPAVKVEDETYKFRGFVGTMDFIHPELKTTFEDDLLVDVIENYLGKYKAEGYEVKTIDLNSYASPGGTVQLNQELSVARAEAVFSVLNERFEENAEAPKNVTFTKRGNGEDWDRLELLTKSADFTEEQRSEVLAITGNSMSLDEKEAEMRKLKFWNKLVEEVLIYCRHTYVSMNFSYAGDMASTDIYGTQVPVISPELYNVATTTSTIKPYAPGVDVQKNMDILNKLITANQSNANLYAMRSTYHYASGDITSAIRDIEQAQSLDRNNREYAVAALAYRTENAYAYSVNERVKMLNTYNDYVARYPDDQVLLYNRAVLMDRIGFISGAMAEYAKIGDRDAIALNNRGVAKLKTHRLTEAEADFAKATQLDPNLPHAHYNLGIVYAYKGLASKSAASLEKAVQLLPALKSDIQSNPVFSVVRNTAEFAKFR